MLSPSITSTSSPFATRYGCHALGVIGVASAGRVGTVGFHQSTGYERLLPRYVKVQHTFVVVAVLAAAVTAAAAAVGWYFFCSVSAKY